MERSKWIAMHKDGIGGTDAVAIVGESPWKTPYQVWLEKRGEVFEDQGQNERMYWGQQLEPLIRQQYADLTGYDVVVPDDVIIHPKYPWIIGTPDGIVQNDRVFEAKTARRDQGWGDPGTDQIPDMYRVQVEHYMLLTELDRADVAVLIGGSDFRIYNVHADPELQQVLFTKEQAFWNMVQKGIPPEITTYADARLRWGSRSEPKRVQVDLDCAEALANLHDLADMKRKEEEWKAIVMKKLGEADTLVDGEIVLATWKLSKASARFDQKAFQTEHPDLYKQFVREGKPSRRFLLKTELKTERTV